MSGYSQIHQFACNVPSRLSHLGRRKGMVIGVFVSLLVLFTFHYKGPELNITNLKPNNHDSNSDTKAEHAPKYFHLLVPANHKDVNLCKTLVSAAVAGFPTPTLINWGMTFDQEGLVAGGSHLAKISGVLSYLQSLDHERDDDLVLVVDGYDIWFQLRPSVLLSRYHEINAAANARIRSQLGSEIVESQRIHQSIVFSAQKRCWPWKADDPPCNAVPESSLPRDVYGPKTDTDIGWDKNPYLKFRQRYLNSGNFMGPVGALRSMFERAKEMAEKDSNFGSDQKIFSQIFGEQEKRRGMLRKQHNSWWHRLWRSVPLLDGSSDEFGVGLDYASLLGHPTVFCEEDAEWLTYTNGTEIREKSSHLGIKTPRVGALADDIRESQPPFRMPVTAADGKMNAETSWTDVPLYSNMWSSVVPGLIHHNAHRDGLKSLRKTVWDRMWYFPHLRDLYDLVAKGPVAPVAVVNDADGRERAWWSINEDKGGAVSDQGEHEWLGWDELCAEYEDEVFRDDKASSKPS